VGEGSTGVSGGYVHRTPVNGAEAGLAAGEIMNLTLVDCTSVNRTLVDMVSRTSNLRQRLTRVRLICPLI
jgi:hypothetical protein